jgi:predicted esterase
VPERERSPRVSPVVVLVALAALLAWIGPARLGEIGRSLFPAPEGHAPPSEPAAPSLRAAAPAAAWPEHESEAETMVRCGAGVLRGGVYASCSGSLGAHDRPLRGGEYFLPERRSGRQLPVLIFLHAEGQSPASVLGHLSPWAERHHFVLIAPEATASSWRVPDAPERTTADALHVLACLLEVQSLPAVALDRERVLVAGAGSGAAEAAYLATNHSELSAFAALGGPLLASSLGPLRVPVWLSTREQDPTVPPQRLLADAALLDKRGFDRVERAVIDSRDAPADEQLRLLIAWWLGIL